MQERAYNDGVLPVTLNSLPKPRLDLSILYHTSWSLSPSMPAGQDLPTIFFKCQQTHSVAPSTSGSDIQLLFGVYIGCDVLEKDKDVVNGTRDQRRVYEAKGQPGDLSR
jgi:hypothetical protein